MKISVELIALKFYAYHGVMPQEQKVGNSFRVDLRCSFKADADLIGQDELGATIDYSVLYEVIKKEMEIPSKLLEHVAYRILLAAKERFPQLASVMLSVTKLAPPIAGENSGASVTLEEFWDL